MENATECRLFFRGRGCMQRVVLVPMPLNKPFSCCNAVLDQRQKVLQSVTAVPLASVVNLVNSRVPKELQTSWFSRIRMICDIELDCLAVSLHGAM
jgi:hypothetical protein